MKKRLPRYPIYIPTKGRADCCMTANFLIRDGCPFRLVVEPQEVELYAKQYGRDCILELPFSDQGSVVPARNWIWEYSISEGYERHWQIDDNCRYIMRWYRNKRIEVDAGAALAISEDFIDRYENVAIGGLNYVMFAVDGFAQAFNLNCHVYSCSCFLNNIPNRFRGRYNEDTDLCLQVLADGWCTILINAFLIQKTKTLLMKGGNTAALEYFHDGRLKMARSLERDWPGVVETKRRFGRPQHVVKNAWKKFDTQLIRKAGVTTDATEPDEHGLVLVQKREVVESEELRTMLKEQKGRTDV